MVAAGGPVRGHRVRRRGLGPASLIGEGAALGEDAAGGHLAGGGQEARDRVQAAVVLTLAAARNAAQQPYRVRGPGLLADLPGRALLDKPPRRPDARRGWTVCGRGLATGTPWTRSAPAAGAGRCSTASRHPGRSR